MDDTLEIIKRGSAEKLTDDLNTVDVEYKVHTRRRRRRRRGLVLFLDILIQRPEYDSLKSEVYQTHKPVPGIWHHPLHRRWE